MKTQDQNSVKPDTQSCQMAVIDSADIQEITFKMVFSVPDGYSCFTDKSEEKFTTIIKDNFNLVESGIGFSCFGIKIEVDNVKDIEIQKNKINKIALSTLKLKPIEKPKTQRKQDVYSVVFDLSGTEGFGLKTILLKQVIYSDDRLFQSLILKGTCLNGRNVINKIKDDSELNKIVHDMVMFNFGSDDLSITFKKDLTFKEKQILEFVKNVMAKEKKYDFID
jgi:hypothetical protein